MPFGDFPALREYLQKTSVPLPDKLGAQGPSGAIVTKGGLVFIGGGDAAFHAIDKASGRDLWSTPTAETTGTPMTYLTSAGRQFPSSQPAVVRTRRWSLSRSRDGAARSESGFHARISTDVDLTPA